MASYAARSRRWTSDPSGRSYAQRDHAIRQALAPQKRGRKVDPQADELQRLRQENERLKARLEQAETIIDVQKKLVTLFGTEARPTPSDEGR